MHITDGIKNVGVTVEYALEFCRLQGVDLITLGCGRAVRAFYPYGDGWELLGTSMDKLPHAVATLLKRKLVKRS
ncbi:MAG: hypothetical protein IBX36_03890 [Dehalococcoidia bacterium]|nr:hypothetical protein [Dehalococcoidia bacterium]